MSLWQSFMQDLDAFLLSGAYVVLVIGVAEVLRARGVARELTRKIVHIGIGTWVVPTYLLFDHRLWAVVPAAAFVLINASAWHSGWMRSVGGERRNVGVILFPLSTALALALFWRPPWPVVGAASILVLAWGDAAAALVGRRHGRHHFELFDHRRSLEGSVAMLAAGSVAVVAAFLAFGAPVDSGVIAVAVLAAALAAGVEAICPWGLDNLLIPATVAVTLVLTRGGIWG